MEKLKIKLSKEFKNVLKNLKKISTDTPKNIMEIGAENIISLNSSDVRWCHKKIKENKLPYRIYELLDNSEIIIPACEPPPLRNPELEKRVQLLKVKQEEREYQGMVKNLDWKSFSAGIGVTEVRKEMMEMNRQLITGVQYLLSIVGTFFGVFFGVSFVITNYGPRVLLSVFASVAVAIAEIYFIIRDDMRQEELAAASNENKKRKTKSQHDFKLENAQTSILK